MYAPQNAQEIRILRLLEEQHSQMAAGYRAGLRSLSNTVEKESDWRRPPLLWAEEDNIHEKFFRYEFDLPVYFTLSYPVSRFKAYRNFALLLPEEQLYYLRMAIVPIYIANLNRITCLKLYGDTADGFSDSQSRAITSTQTVWRLDPDNLQPAQYSSLNFVLKQASVANPVTGECADIISNYLRYGFWSFARKGFTSNAHIIFSPNSIRHIHKVYKNIFAIRRLHSPRQMRLAPYYHAIVQRADIETYDENGRSRFSTYVAKYVVDQLDEHQVWTADASAVIINGLIYELKGRSPATGGELSLLSLVSELLPTDIELPKTITGLVAFKLFMKSDFSTGFITSEDCFRDEIEKQFRLYAGLLRHGTTLFELMGKPLHQILSELYPVVISSGTGMYYVHPSIISALIWLGFEDSILRRDIQLLVHFIKLLERMYKEEKQGRLRFAEESQYFKRKGIDFDRLIRAGKSAYRSIIMSRLLQKFF